MNKADRMGNRWLQWESNILLQMLLVVVPLLAFTGILLGLVYIYQWKEQIDGLSLDSGYASGVLYVDFSATRLILVASWSSSVALPLIGSLLSLTSYVVAADMLWSSKMSFHGLLPTPSQLAMLTDLLDAKKFVLIIWISDLWSRSKRTIPSRWMIEFPAMVQIAALILSGAILMADTWLHVATSSKTMPFLSEIHNPAVMGTGYQHSRNLTAECWSSYYDACSVALDKQNINRTLYPDKIKNLMLDEGTYPTQINSSADGTYFLAPRFPRVDGLTNNLNYQSFTATTIGGQATCDRNMTMCRVVDAVPGSRKFQFFCGGGMNGTIEYPSTFAIAYWSQYFNQTYYQAYWRVSGTSSTSTFGVVAVLENMEISDWRGENPLPSLEFDRTPEEGGGQFKGVIVATKCTLSFLTMGYSWDFDTVLPKMKYIGRAIQAADTARAPVLTGYFNGTDFDGAMRDRWWSESGLESDVNKSIHSNTSSDVVRGFQKSMGRVGLALLGGTIQGVDVSHLSLANSTVVTVVGKTPLFTLIILNIWYALFGLILFTLAFFVLRDPTTRRDVIEIQQLISVEGLASAAVKRQRGNLALNNDDLRVGVEKVDGEWQFRVWEVGNAEQGKGLLADYAAEPT